MCLILYSLIKMHRGFMALLSQRRAYPALNHDHYEGVNRNKQRRSLYDILISIHSAIEHPRGWDAQISKISMNPFNKIEKLYCQ